MTADKSYGILLPIDTSGRARARRGNREREMGKTRYFGHDCLGNTPHAVTIEGVCICDIYEPQGRQYFNQQTGQVGAVRRADDGELHFYPAA